MTTLETGVYGAKVQSWKRASPRDLLKRLIDENPNSSKEDLLKKFSDKVTKNHLDAIIEYWFANNYNSLTERKAPAPSREQKRAIVEQRKSEIKARAVNMVFLDLVLPNGKPLRDCTGKDCAKAGGLFAKIANKIKPNEIVGKVLSETEVRKLYR